MALNESHTKTRNPFENINGQVKNRFPCLQGTLRTNIPRAVKFITGCCVLHNIAIEQNDIFEPADPLPVQHAHPMPHAPVQDPMLNSAAVRMGKAHKNYLVQ